MKVRIDIDENVKEDEIIIRCGKLDENTQKVYNTLMELAKGSQHLMLYKGNVEYYLPLDNILFFETMDNCISAHTANNVYDTSYRLYELEEMLPGYFMRVSKSTILNINHIYSISRNLTASSEVQFLNSHKQVYVSRLYYKSLKFRLEEKRRSI
ncbi:MAG TPA: LytTR family DNA-binding domain-containing protein [Mobilitalea sp.]|nr:LytTR family DNA-binding domain-containing protein [Mobilitalea sp.]